MRLKKILTVRMNGDKPDSGERIEGKLQQDERYTLRYGLTALCSYDWGTPGVYDVKR